MNSINFQPAEVSVVRDKAQAAVMLQGDRLILLKHLREPASATGLAKQLGRPRQQVNYHLRALEQAGFLKLVAEKKARNCVERVVQATAQSYVLSPDVLAELGGQGAGTKDRFSSAYLLAMAAQTIGELGAIREQAREQGKTVATLSLQADVHFASPADRNGFAEELATAFSQLIQKYHRPDHPESRPFRFSVGAYPVPGPPSDSDNQKEEEDHE